MNFLYTINLAYVIMFETKIILGVPQAGARRMEGEKENRDQETAGLILVVR